MSDAKLRELERRWKETGSVEDEAAYLLERVRVGDLTREKLAIAAWFGVRAAIEVVGAGEPPDLPESEHHLVVALGLLRLGLLSYEAVVQPPSPVPREAFRVVTRHYCDVEQGDMANTFDRLESYIISPANRPLMHAHAPTRAGFVGLHVMRNVLMLLRADGLLHPPAEWEESIWHRRQQALRAFPTREAYLAAVAEAVPSAFHGRVTCLSP